MNEGNNNLERQTGSENQNMVPRHENKAGMIGHRGPSTFHEYSIALTHPMFLRSRVPTRGDLRVKERKVRRRGEGEK